MRLIFVRLSILIIVTNHLNKNNNKKTKIKKMHVSIKIVIFPIAAQRSMTANESADMRVRRLWSLFETSFL